MDLEVSASQMELGLMTSLQICMRMTAKRPGVTTFDEVIYRSCKPH